MSFQPGGNLYTVSFGTRPESVEVPHIDTRAPSSADVNYPQGKWWINQTVGSNAIYNLTSFSSSNGAVTANWEPVGGGAIGLEALNGDMGTATPTAHAITIAGGTGISTVASGSTVTINVVGEGSKFSVVTTNTAMAINQGYITNKSGSAATMTLPAVAALGSVIEVVGMNATGWIVAQNAGQTIHMNAASTTTGAGGSLASTAQYNTVKLLCTVANTDWTVTSSEGILTVT